MSFVQGFRLGLDARRNPFDAHWDIAGRGHLFIYLTGRGELSYLFPDAPESDIIGEVERCIPMGYTQIWILRWMVSVRPEPGKKTKPFDRRAAQDLAQAGIREGRSYVLIGENSRCFGHTEKLHCATGAAGVLAAENSVRIAIGLLKANVTWH